MDGDSSDETGADGGRGGNIGAGLVSKCVIVYTCLHHSSYTLICPFCVCLVQTYIHYKRKPSFTLSLLLFLFFTLWITSSIYSYYLLHGMKDVGELTVRYFYYIFSHFTKVALLNCVLFGLFLLFGYKRCNCFIAYHNCLNCNSSVAQFGSRGFFRLLMIDSNFNKPISSRPTLLPKLVCYSVFILYILSNVAFIFYKFY